MRICPGLALCVAVALPATWLGRLEPGLGGPIFGVVFGMALAPAAGRWTRFEAGIRFASRRVLQLAVVLLGAGLSIHQVLATGFRSLPVLLGTFAIALIVARLAGRLLGVHGNHQLLIGVGTAICGASAIGATALAADATTAEVSYAISTIFVFNIIAVLSFPGLGHLMGLSQHAFGLWTGTAINDVSSVVAAATTYGHAARNYAVVAKLTRTLMIIPVVLVVSYRTLRRHQASNDGSRLRSSWRQAIPWFIAWFLAAVIANSSHVFPDTWHGGFSKASTAMITVALAGVGLSARYQAMQRAGARPLMLGATIWLSVVLGSLALQFMTGQG